MAGLRNSFTFKAKPRKLYLPAPSSNVAQAARAYGDNYPKLNGTWRIRATGVLLICAIVLYVLWLPTALNTSEPLLAWPFLLANIFTLSYGLLSVFNMWSRRIPTRHPVSPGDEPTVATIIPTYGEPVSMVLRTVSSIFEQDWPIERLVVVVSDDGHNPELKTALTHLPVIYHTPPTKSSPDRQGEAKAGNLNSALNYIEKFYPEVQFIETRDADDELGSNGFLRQVVGQLQLDEKLAYVQTIKEAQVSEGDPFNNWESMFYRSLQLGRNQSNAVIPCGSGLVWRKAALNEIGNFPTWNLVEDLQSGVEALRRGWKGMYLPIVGAVAQHAPEDISNISQQRATWAIDSVRLMFWGNLKGLNLRQRAQFVEMLYFYLNSLTALVYIPSIILTCFGDTPLKASGVSYLIHMLPIVLAIELWLLVLGRPFFDRRVADRRPYRDLWRIRIMWTGLTPVYIKATLKGIFGGPNNKPVYKVTRKQDDVRIHWREVMPQVAILLAVLTAFSVSVFSGTFPSFNMLVGDAYWGGIYVFLFMGFITRSWHGIGRRSEQTQIDDFLPELEAAPNIATSSELITKGFNSISIESQGKDGVQRSAQC